MKRGAIAACQICSRISSGKLGKQVKVEQEIGGFSLYDASISRFLVNVCLFVIAGEQDKDCCKGLNYCVPVGRYTK